MAFAKTLVRGLMIVMIGATLSGCAMRGALKIDCDNFASRIHPLPLTPIERQIRGRDPEDIYAPENPLVNALAGPTLSRLTSDEAFLRTPLPAPRPVLLLSGGGQWGAFGVGLMNRLIEQENGDFPDFAIVTGVSTGALQALFVGARMDAKDKDDPMSAMAPALRKALAEAYAPARESDVVDRESAQFLAGFTGALANLKPLRRRFEERICPRIYAPQTSDYCLIPRLRDMQGRRVFLGMIAANTGEFGYIDVQELLAPYGNSDEDLAKATQCLAGAALSSAAVPVFYQQVRVDGRTYYDGGVRQSVFLAAVIEAQREAALQAQAQRLDLMGKRGIEIQDADRAPPPFAAVYVIRNGPTVLGPDENVPAGYPARIDRKADALRAAQRGEAIMVNQLEVGSIAALRLVQPGGVIKFVSADGWDTYSTREGVRCGPLKTPREAMFIPAFMRCLQDYGANRATGTSPWIELCRYDGTETRSVCRSRRQAAPNKVQAAQ